MAIVFSPVTGTVWKVLVSTGDVVEAGEELMILESMKMEIPVEAECDGEVATILCGEGDSIREGNPLLELA